jgi:uncharacterized protein YegL
MNPSLRLLLPLLLAPCLAAQSVSPSAGHARTRELAELGKLPTPLDVAVADIVNYHRHRLPLPRAGEPVAMDVRFGGEAAVPGGEAMLQIGFTTAPSGDRQDLPPLNLALVIDCSGSMADAGKLDAVKRGLLAFADRLRRDDQVAIVTFSDEAQLLCPRRPFDGGGWFRSAVEQLAPGGSTNLHGGLMLGLREVGNDPLPRGSNRVILLTDGIANRGVVEPEAILADSRKFTAEDVDLTTIGVGKDLDTALLDRLARGGRGLFHFVADGKDIAKVFVDEAEGLIASVARAVELRVELPPGLELVQSYGHEYRRDGRELVFALPDMNRGMTAVVLLRCRCTAAAGASATARVALRAQAVGGGRINLHGEATLRCAGRVALRAGDEVAFDLDHTHAELAALADVQRVTRNGTILVPTVGPVNVVELEADQLERLVAGLLAARFGGELGVHVRGTRVHTDPLADPEVKKNATIALLAQGMHDMAEQAQQSRWTEADRILQRAIDTARARLPDAQDPDVRTVLEMAEGHARTLRRYVDRFRDYE